MANDSYMIVRRLGLDKADITIRGGIDATLAKIPQIKEAIKEKIALAE